MASQKSSQGELRAPVQKSWRASGQTSIYTFEMPSFLLRCSPADTGAYFAGPIPGRQEILASS